MHQFTHNLWGADACCGGATFFQSVASFVCSEGGLNTHAPLSRQPFRTRFFALRFVVTGQCTHSTGCEPPFLFVTVFAVPKRGVLLVFTVQ